MAENYTIKGQIGFGAFGNVLLVESKEKQLFAKKSIEFDNEFEQAENIEEIKVLGRYGNNHPHIVKLVDHFPDGPDIYSIIFEYCEVGDLNKFIRNSPEKKISITLATLFLKQIADALGYLHSNRVIHRDIKPKNILLSRDFDGQIIIKLTDFGLAKLASKAASTMKGTSFYMAPEILGREEHYTSKVDMWALGCTYYEMITGKRLFNSNKTNDLLKEIETLSSRFPIDLDKFSLSILTGLLQKDPDERIAAGEVLARCAEQLDTTRYFDNLGSDHAINNFDGNHIPSRFVRDSYGANDSTRRSLQERGIPDEQPPFSLASHSSSIARKRTLSASSSNNSRPSKSSTFNPALSNNEDTYLEEYRAHGITKEILISTVASAPPRAGKGSFAVDSSDDSVIAKSSIILPALPPALSDDENTSTDTINLAGHVSLPATTPYANTSLIALPPPVIAPSAIISPQAIKKESEREFKAEQTRQPPVLTGHTDWVLSLVSLGDDSIASGSRDKSIKIWNISTEKCDKTLTGHSDRVSSLLSLGGGLLASGSFDKTIKIWNITAERCEKTLQGHTRKVYCLSFLGDGRIASGSVDTTIKLWSITRGNCEMTLTGHDGWVESLLSLEGKLVSGSEDNSIKIWNILTRSCEITLTGHRGCVRSLVSLEGGLIASGSGDKSIKIWNLSTGNCEQTLTGHSNTVISLVSLGTGRFVSGSEEKSIKIWSLATGLKQALEGHSSGVNCLLSLEGGRRIISGSWDKTIRVWDI